MEIYLLKENNIVIGVVTNDPSFVMKGIPVTIANPKWEVPLTFAQEWCAEMSATSKVEGDWHEYSYEKV